MKRFLSLLLLLLLPRLVHAGSADADFQVISGLLAVKTPAGLTSGSARFHWSADHRNRINDLCEKFMADYPADPRRWEAAMIMFSRPRTFVKFTDDAKLDQQRPGTVIQGAVEYDKAAQEKWRERLAALDAQCAAATDMTPEIRRKYELSALVRHVTAAGTATTMKKPVDLAAIRAELDRAIAAYPDSGEVARAFNSYVSVVKRQGTPADEIMALLEAYADSPSAGVREIVQTGLMMKKAQDFPIDWKFTAADGREVDFAKLRGKVVLIDFWATWCHPCVEEIPNVVAAYAKYHDQGFEVVGMTLENAGVPPTATPEAAQARLDASRNKMLAFTKEKGMPWPQYFDGTGWKNPYTAKYGIRGIPAMFLLDQEGKVASLDARGQKLETELKRLLKH